MGVRIYVGVLLASPGIAVLAQLSIGNDLPNGGRLDTCLTITV